MPTSDVHPAAMCPEELVRQCRVERLRRSGPGGQHRNKVETAVRLIHLRTGVRAEATERRSQEENRRRALRRLRVNLALAVRLPRDPAAGPSQDWRARVAAGQIHIGREHADFPALLAEALDVIAGCEGDLTKASEALQCTPSQLVKLLRKEPRALALVNRDRERRGADRLR